jgi:hypothetical protein
VQAQYADIQVLSAQTYQSTTFTGPDDQALRHRGTGSYSGISFIAHVRAFTNAIVIG